MNDNERKPSRTKSQYVDDKAVEDFTRVLDQVFTDPSNAGDHLDELAKMMGADGSEPDAGPMPERFRPGTNTNDKA